jgi:hypothetical protein
MITEIIEQGGLARPRPACNKGVPVRFLHEIQGMLELGIEIDGDRALNFSCHSKEFLFSHYPVIPLLCKGILKLSAVRCRKCARCLPELSRHQGVYGVHFYHPNILISGKKYGCFSIFYAII